VPLSPLLPPLLYVLGTDPLQLLLLPPIYGLPCTCHNSRCRSGYNCPFRLCADRILVVDTLGLDKLCHGVLINMLY
jgi:hypothetical protein